MVIKSVPVTAYPVLVLADRLNVAPEAASLYHGLVQPVGGVTVI
jgi:hypothetical protein